MIFPDLSQHIMEYLNGVMALDLSATEGISSEDQRWPWWPLLPLGYQLQEQA